MRPDSAVKDAEREAADAEHDLEALKERVRNGDQAVTPERIAAQQQVVDFARLRVDAAQRSAARLREEERQQLAAHARAAAAHLIAEEGSAEIVAATKAAAEAIAALRRAVDARNAKLAAVASNVAQLANLSLSDGGPNDALKATRPYGVWGDYRYLTVQGAGSVSAYRAGELAAAALVVGLGADEAGTQAGREAAGVISSLPNLVINRLGRDVPGLADSWRMTAEEWQSASQRGRHQATEQGRRPLPEQR